MTQMGEPWGWKTRLANSPLFRRDPITGQGALVIRLYRLRLWPAFIISLPLLMVMAWYVTSALLEYRRYASASGYTQPLDLSLFQLFLHDRLSRDLWRHRIRDVQWDETLPVFSLRLGNAELTTLDRALPPDDGSSEYVPGLLKKGKKVVKAGFRYRGSRHWHWACPQKSWKIRLAGDEHIDEQRTLNLINPVDPLPVSEQLVMGLAGRLGVLTPEYYPAHVLLNDAYMGLYHLQGQPDEAVLRRSRRLQGNIYSGNGAPVDPVTKVSRLFWSPKAWKRPASREGVSKDDRTDLERLLTAVTAADPEAFTVFARKHLHLESFAALDALDVVFGNNQHDWDENHKLLFDATKGRFEPIAWNFRGWQHRHRFNRVDHPLLIRLKEIPEYLPLRNRLVWNLLTGPCTPEAIRAASLEEMEKVLGALAGDPYWDAFELLPDDSNYFSQMVRPMTIEKQERVFLTRMQEFTERHEYLISELSALHWRGHAHMEGTRLTVDISLAGHSGVQLSALEVLDSFGKAVPSSWACDANGSGEWETTDPPLLLTDHGHGLQLLTPGFRLTPRGRVHPKRGAVVLQPEEMTYRLFSTTATDTPPLGKDNAPLQIRVTGIHALTGEDVLLNLTVSAGTPPPVAPQCQPSKALFEAGRSSWNRWCLLAPPPGTVVLGPETVSFGETREFGPQETVEILPGTRIELKNGASLIFRGPTRFSGTGEKPISVDILGEEGGLALIGPDTRHSRIQHVVVNGGGAINDPMVTYTAVLNIQDTTDISLEHVRLTNGRNEGLHAAYVQGLVLKDVQLSGFGNDCVDIEFSQGSAHGLTLAHCGDECMDLMGSDLTGENWILLQCRNSGLSAGEETTVRVSRTLIGHSRRCLAVKNASSVRLDDSLIAGCGEGIRVQKKQPRYNRPSKVKGRNIVVLNATQPFRNVGRKLKETVSLSLDAGALPGLRTALGLASWNDLEGLMNRVGGKP
jgi:hypothetical protein